MVLGRYYKVTLKSGRKFEGKMIVIDKHMNMCLTDCKETFNVEVVRKCRDPVCDICEHSFKKWGVVSIFGADVVDINESESLIANP
jgi:small nuclear ribonucleoprotein (snRNP)-like protein